MSVYLNSTGVPLSVAIWLACDTYDYIPNTISATSLIKSTRQLVLSKRVSPEDAVVDVLNVTKSRMGHAIHDSIEKAWKTDYVACMQALGYPQHIIDKIVINPDPETVTEAQIPVYMEQRAFRELDGYTISGKYDFVAEGRVEDFKSTACWKWASILPENAQLTKIMGMSESDCKKYYENKYGEGE
jgi:hypothetical protein